jgi:hypothetical protein
MIKDDLIRMADLAGFDVDDDDDVHAPAQGRYGLDPRLEHFARLVTAFEREACARICQREIKKIKEREKNKRERLIQKIAQPEQEPVAWMEDSIEFYAKDHPTNSCTIPLYPAPPSKPWQSLTDEEIDYIWGISEGDYKDKFDFPRKIEAKLKEKNT